MANDWREGLPKYEVAVLEHTSIRYAEELLLCTCAADSDAPPCHHDLGCPASFRADVAIAIAEAATNYRRCGVGPAPLVPFQVRFDGPPGPVAGRFVEVEDLEGRGLGIGEWVEDGEHWLLVFR